MRIYLDTNIFIYLFENKEPFRSQFLKFYAQNDAEYYTSVFTLGEILVKVYQSNRLDLVDEYSDNIKNFVEKMVVIDEDISKNYAKIRASHTKLSKPDVLHLASALSCSEVFLTNDQRLWNIAIENISIKGFSDPDFVDETENNNNYQE
jgi:predicted nucleic acid-binding protein